jgi:hypothetical protein
MSRAPRGVTKLIAVLTSRSSGGAGGASSDSLVNALFMRSGFQVSPQLVDITVFQDNSNQKPRRIQKVAHGAKTLGSSRGGETKSKLRWDDNSKI